MWRPFTDTRLAGMEYKYMPTGVVLHCYCYTARRSGPKRFRIIAGSAEEAARLALDHKHGYPDAEAAMRECGRMAREARASDPSHLAFNAYLDSQSPRP